MSTSRGPRDHDPGTLKNPDGLFETERLFNYQLCELGTYRITFPVESPGVESKLSLRSEVKSTWQTGRE